MDTSLDKVRGWHAKASDVDYEAKFIFEYLAFIVSLQHHVHLDINAKGSRDRSLIQSFKRDKDIKNQYLELVAGSDYPQYAPMEDDWFKIDEYSGEYLVEVRLDNYPGLRHNWYSIATILNEAHHEKRQIFDNDKDFWNCSHPPNCDCTNKSDAIIHNDQDWINMVEFWYSLRTNLLHGKIYPDDEKYQQLIKYGYFTLKPLVELLICLQDEKYWTGGRSNNRGLL